MHRSNETDPDKGKLYWQTGDWLVRYRYAVLVDGDTYVATDRGRGLGMIR